MLKNSWVCRLWLLWEMSPTALIFLDFCHCGCHFHFGGLWVSDSKHILYLLELKAANLLGQRSSDMSEINSHLQTMENYNDKKRPILSLPKHWCCCIRSIKIALLQVSDMPIIFTSTWNTFATHFTFVMWSIYDFVLL